LGRIEVRIDAKRTDEIESRIRENIGSVFAALNSDPPEIYFRDWPPEERSKFRRVLRDLREV
jgi:hypothetical protein